MHVCVCVRALYTKINKSGPGVQGSRVYKQKYGNPLTQQSFHRQLEWYGMVWNGDSLSLALDLCIATKS